MVLQTQASAVAVAPLEQLEQANPSLLGKIKGTLKSFSDGLMLFFIVKRACGKMHKACRVQHCLTLLVRNIVLVRNNV